jgi:hypothetical protein
MSKHSTLLRIVHIQALLIPQHSKVPTNHVLIKNRRMTRITLASLLSKPTVYLEN